jgi:hypothetical protein
MPPQQHPANCSRPGRTPEYQPWTIIIAGTAPNKTSAPGSKRIKANRPASMALYRGPQLQTRQPAWNARLTVLPGSS